jgi:hypothetical protein
MVIPAARCEPSARVYIRHKKPIRHSFLEMPGDRRLSSGDRYRQRLAGGRSEFDNVSAVVFRPEKDCNGIGQVGLWSPAGLGHLVPSARRCGGMLMLRRSCVRRCCSTARGLNGRTRNANNRSKVRVGTTHRSMAAIACVWFRRNVLQVCEGGAPPRTHVFGDCRLGDRKPTSGSLACRFPK